jgi:hypothetical protein
MSQTFLGELRQLRQRFSVLAVLLLVLPLLAAALPRDARSAAIAEIANASICSTSGGTPDPDGHRVKQLCENCLPGTACATAPAKGDAVFLATLHPPRRLLGRLSGEDVQPKEILSKSIRGARAPPIFL